MRKPARASASDFPGGPPAGTLVVRLDDLPDHGGKDIVFSDGKMRLQLLVQKIGHQVYVYENRCPHAGTPLNLFNDRFLDGTGKRLICRTHGALFAPENGHCVAGPCKGQYLRAILVEIRDGGIFTA